MFNRAATVPFHNNDLAVNMLRGRKAQRIGRFETHPPAEGRRPGVFARCPGGKNSRRDTLFFVDLAALGLLTLRRFVSDPADGSPKAGGRRRQER
jgi:hypothetical protein